MLFTRKMFNGTMSLLHNHTALWAIVGSCGLAASFTASIMVHTSRKTEVTWLKRKKAEYESVPWNKRSQKLVTAVCEAPLYQEDASLKALMNEIYTGTDYKH